MKRPSTRMRALAVLGLSAAALISALAPARAQTIGRLFATPLERATLDANRGKAPQAGQSGGDPLPGQPGAVGMPADGGGPGGPGGGGSPSSAPPAQETLAMNGVLRSSSGRSTVWLNNVPQSGVQNKLAKRGKNSQALTVTLPSGKKVILQAGQRYDVSDGRVKDINEP